MNLVDDTPIVPGDVHPAFQEVEAARQVLNDAEADLRDYQLNVDPIHSNAGNLGMGAMPNSVVSQTEPEVYTPTQSEAHRPTQSENYKPTQSEAYTPAQSEAYTPTHSEAYKTTQSEAHNPVQPEAYKPISFIDVASPSNNTIDDRRQTSSGSYGNYGEVQSSYPVSDAQRVEALERQQATEMH